LNSLFDKSQTLKNLALILTGNFSAQIISLLFYPLLARIYEPTDFGLFGTYSSFIVVSAIFASGQLHMAFIKAKDSEELSQINWLFRFYSFFGTIVVTGIVFLIDHAFGYFPEYYILFFPVSLVAYMFFDAAKMISIREDKFKFMSQAVGLNRFTSNILKVVSGKLLAHPVTLIFSEIAAQSISILFMRKKLKVLSIRPSSPFSLLKKFNHFPLFATFSTFFQLGLIELPVIILAKYYSPNEIGFYVLSLKILLNPLTVIGNSIGSVVSKKMVEDHHKNNSNQKSLIQVYGAYLVIGVVAFSTVYVVPERWLLFILGQKWQGFKDYLLPITLLVTAKLSSGVHIYFYVATEEMRAKSVWKALQLVTSLIIIFKLSYLPFVQLLWIVCITEAILDFCFTIYTVFETTKVKTKS